MDAMEKERLIKANHDCQFLAFDLLEVMTKTDSVSLKIVALDMIEEVQHMSQRLRGDQPTPPSSPTTRLSVPVVQSGEVRPLFDPPCPPRGPRLGF